MTTASGAISIRNNDVGEIMHNPVGPWEEANALYIEPSGLCRLLAQSDGGADPVADPVVVYDVGLGAAANALAALRATLGLGGARRRRLHIVSFENDLTLLEFTIAHADQIPYVREFGGALRSLLEHRAWASACGGVTWELLPGDFLDTVASATVTPDLVFFDPYSPMVNRGMWGHDCFARLRAVCTGEEKTTTLFTYTMATPVRAAMLLAGFYVGRGPATGLKRETTQASTDQRALLNPLDERWLVRWLRSHAKFPYDADPQTVDRMTHDVLYHPQFIDLVSDTLLRPLLQSHPRLSSRRALTVVQVGKELG